MAVVEEGDDDDADDAEEAVDLVQEDVKHCVLRGGGSLFRERRESMTGTYLSD